MQFYTLIFCSIISVTYQVFIIINCSSRLVQCLRILDVNRKVVEGRGGGGQQEGRKGRKEGGRQIGGEYGVGRARNKGGRECWSVGGCEGGRKITA